MHKKDILSTANNGLHNQLHFLLWVCACTLWITLIAIVPDFLDNPIGDVRTGLTVVSYVLACSVVSFLLFYAVGQSKWVTALLLPIYGIIGAAVSYYRIGYQVTITPVIIECMFKTNAEEVRGVVGWQLIGWIVLNLCISIGFVVWRWRKITLLRYAVLQTIVAILLFIGYYSIPRMQRSLNQRYPLHIVHSLREYAIVQTRRNAPRTTPAYIKKIYRRRGEERRGEETSPTDSLNIVVVIGESVRADHLQLNGYQRETTPQLARRKNVVSFPYVRSIYTHTAASVPLMLTRADSLHLDYQYTEHSFASILRENGYYTAWIANQEMDESFATFPMECDTTIYPSLGKSTYVFSGWYDNALLPPTKEILAKKHAKNLILLHEIGSHWYYNFHVPEAEWYFKPVTTNRVVRNNTVEQVVNSYDNSIRYMDCVLDSLLMLVEGQRTILFYLSDHGESLGENGNFCHAGEAEEMHSCGAFVWYSDSFAQTYLDKVQALEANKNNAYYTDILFHSVLSAAGLQLKDADDSMDILSSQSVQ